jgi:hypothetical protein
MKETLRAGTRVLSPQIKKEQNFMKNYLGERLFRNSPEK